MKFIWRNAFLWFKGNAGKWIRAIKVIGKHLLLKNIKLLKRTPSTWESLRNGAINQGNKKEQSRHWQTSLVLKNQTGLLQHQKVQEIYSCIEFGQRIPKLENWENYGWKQFPDNSNQVSFVSLSHALLHPVHPHKAHSTHSLVGTGCNSISKSFRRTAIRRSGRQLVWVATAIARRVWA